MSFLENLILGIIGSELIDDVERLHDQRSLEREQHRHDSLFGKTPLDAATHMMTSMI